MTFLNVNVTKLTNLSKPIFFTTSTIRFLHKPKITILTHLIKI